jgi:hypothetical protein
LTSRGVAISSLAVFVLNSMDPSNKKKVDDILDKISKNRKEQEGLHKLLEIKLQEILSGK